MFLGLVGGIVLIVWIVKGTFAEDKWVAIGAAAALLQAVGVVGGVIYAAPLKAIREESRTSRSNALLDQLAGHFSQMERESRSAKSSWETLCSRRALGQQMLDEGIDRKRVDAFFGPLFDADREKYQLTKASLINLFEAAEPLILALTRERNLEFQAVHLFGRMLPSSPSKLFEDEPDTWGAQFFETIDGHIKKFRSQIALHQAESAPLIRLRK
jgi:hypothetical protein